MSAAFLDWRRDTYALNTGAVWQEEAGLLEAVSSEEMLWKPRVLKKNAIGASDGLGATKWDVSWHLADSWFHPWGITSPMLRPDVSSLQWDDFIPSCSMRLRRRFRLQDELLNHLAATLFDLHVWLPGFGAAAFRRGIDSTVERLTDWLAG